MVRGASTSDSVELQSLTGRKIGKSDEPAQLGEHDRDIASFEGFITPLWKQFVFYILGLISGGVVFLCAKWSLKMKVALTLTACPLPEAEWVLVTLVDKRQELTRVSRMTSFASINIQASSAAVYVHADGGITDGMNSAAGVTGDGFDRMLEPADEWERADRHALYGANELSIPVKSPLELLAEEMIHPFYVFQYASVLIWCLEAYYSYSLIIVAITMFSILTTVYQTYRYRKRLAALAHYTCEVQVMQPGGSAATLNSTELVPGDVVVVHPGILPADLVLLRGEAIVDENMLTGEAVPVRKVSYVPDVDGPNYDADVCKSCTLYGGTAVAQVRPGGVERMALGVVVRTAFWTAKGQLMKSILFPRAHKDSFAKDSMLFIAVMLSLGLAFYIWDIVALASYGAPAGFIILRYLDLVTVAVPPALPACLTVATAIAVSRLAEHGIFVSNPSAINAAGHLDTICFDKTGTLTEPGLDLMGVVPVVKRQLKTNSSFSGNGSRGNSKSSPLPIHSNGESAMQVAVLPVADDDDDDGDDGNTQSSILQVEAPVVAPAQQPVCSDLVPGVEALPANFQEILATCHGLAQLDGELVGDPLDQRLFESTRWSMLDDGAGAPVEIVAVADEGYAGDDGLGIQFGGLHATSPRNLTGSPRHRVPGSPGVLTTAHVHTKVAPPPGGVVGLRGVYTIIRRFEFSSEKQRNVVVVAHPDGSLHVHVKGSPEMMRKLADSASVPLDFDTELAKHTREGLRVLGLATRLIEGVNEVEVQSLTQDDLERGLRFMGFAVMINPLREDTGAVLKELQTAGIRTIMVTGDHARTAVSVANQCGMLQRGKAVAYLDTQSSEGRVEDTCMKLCLAGPDGSAVDSAAADAILQGIATSQVEAAVTGRGFERLGLEAEEQALLSSPTFASSLAAGGAPSLDHQQNITYLRSSMAGGGLDLALHRAGVFARMSPDDKRLLMELLGEGTVGLDGEETPGLGHHVGFCGDGANDVGALKSAHVGVSLCEAEASVAAPLTSKRQTIACMVAVVAEGRCSLDTSYLIFKFIIVYAFVQVFAVNLMYSFGGSVGNYQYLIQDLLYTTVLAGTMGFTRPAKKLTSQRPPERLMSAGIWFPVISQFVVCATFQLAALIMLAQQPWYVRFDPEPGATGTNCFARETANSPECSQSWENSCVFVMSLGQFLITALVFNKGPPHRRGLWTNTWLLVALVLQTSFLLFVVFSPGGVVSETFAGMVPFPLAGFRFKMLGMLLLNFAASWLADHVAVLGYGALRGKRLCGLTII
ncbi:putative Polyamine-transporting ATPase 13A3 [Nannochloris sp. 'desiccata']|nr:putative Polyamine-transporting ATPase 13A3 [Chlorella desiccata (nom. nud.)]